MLIRIVTPAPRGSRKGNRITALRWAGILRSLRHRVVLEQEYAGGACDLLIALHAVKSAPSVERYRSGRPEGPLFVVLTGTDVYGELPDEGMRSLEAATRILILQPLAAEELPSRLRDRTRVVYQSAQPPRRRERPAEAAFEVCVLGHLRPVKDPFRTAEAARLLPPSSRLRVLHAGAALTEEMAERARAEERGNPRYRWLGERSRQEALCLLTRCRLLVLSSLSEGGAGVISEALAAGTPVLSSRIPGSLGMLGADYPGYFPTGDTDALAELLNQAETDPAYLDELRAACARSAPRFTPEHERETWRHLLEELGPAA